MKPTRLFALMALLPAALNASPAAARNGAAGMAVLLCTGDGAVRTVNLPVGEQDVPGKQVPGCCVKGCHTGGERKRGKRCC